MKLSIIIVSYNEEKFLSEAIESCLKQIVDFPIEIIIGDDGSTDGSIEIIKKYSQTYPDIIKYFVMDRSDAIDVIPSIRVSNIIKRAFLIAKGDYFTLISGDDILIDNNKLSIQVDFLEKNKQYVSCYTNYKKIWNDGKEIVCRMKHNISRMLFWSSRYVHISCFVFRKDVLKNILDNFCDDTGLIYSIFMTGKSMRIDRLSFAYRQRDESIMNEADKLELYVLELLLFEDILKKGVYKKSSLSRFAQPLKYIYDHKSKLKEEKYNKYIKFSLKNSNSIIRKIINYEKLNKLEKISIKTYIKKALFLRKIFEICCKIEMRSKYFLK